MKTQKSAPFWDASLPVEKRLDWLLKEMTIEEKLGYLSSRSPDLPRLGIPGMSVGGEAAHGVEARNDQNEIGRPEPTTSFVQPVGMSATWDPELIQKAGAVTGTEARVLYHRHPDRGLSRWAPTVDLERDPRWGRTEEGYGEDPVLTGEMSSAYIRGMQGDHPYYIRTAATLKHFYANNTEAGRGWKNSSIDPRNRCELYLEPFRRAIEKGHAEGIMTAYNKINGVPGILNHEVQDMLKDQYGLTHAVSDGGATALVKSFHHYFGSNAETVAGAVRAGVDAMSDDPVMVEQAAKEAWELGILTEEEIDRAIRNVFRTKLRLGIYDRENQNPYDRVTEADLDSEENRAICREVSREAVVLMKNEASLLPLDPAEAAETALIGPMADAWYTDWYGGHAPFRTTLKDGVSALMQKTQNPGEICFADGQDRVTFWYGEKAVAVAKDGALCISDTPDVFVKEDWGEGSITFRSVRTGKFMNTRLYMKPDAEEAPGRIAAEKDEPLDWFVMELFHIREQEDGSVILTNRFDSPVQVAEDGSLWSMREGEAAHFVMKVEEDGIAAACQLAAEKKTVILALGCNSMINAKEEIDRGTIALPPAQERLLEEICRVNPRVVLVLFSNYPYAIGAAKEQAPAILWSATGAQDMGAAMAETIFGKNHPAGRLNLTWYVDDSQLPDIDDYDIIKGGRTYRYFDGDVLYPFGYGLTYSTFVYSDLSVKLSDDTKLLVTFHVTNTGDCVSDEVAQVYGSAPASRVRKPLRQLLGFTRLKEVAPGETRTVELTIPADEFRFYDVLTGTLMVEEGTYTIWAGASCMDTAVTIQIALPGQKTGFRNIMNRIKADHYDDYENIELTEGQFGFTAATVAAKEGEGVLYYRDCMQGEAAASDSLNVRTEKVAPAPMPGETPITKEDDAKARADGAKVSGPSASADGNAPIHPAVLSLRLLSEQGGRVAVTVNGREAASWEGDTRLYEEHPMMALDESRKQDAIARMATWKPVWTDVKLQLPEGLPADRRSEIAIRISGDIKICWWRVV